MRLKNIKGAKEYVEKSEYVVLNQQDYFGKWNKLFNNDHDIHIEIGMGRGDFIIGMALQNPDINYVGIEIYDSVLYKAIKKLEEYPSHIENLYIIKMDAIDIEKVFNHEVSRIYLNFSDPWPKAKHEKRRLTSKQFLDRYDNVFNSKEEIFQKTDNNYLFEFSMNSLQEHGYLLKNVTRDLYSNMIEGNIATEYETRFSKRGVKINRLEAYK